jgi:hypothetical protein
MTQAENPNITNLSRRTVLAGLSARRFFAYGSNVRIIRGNEETALIRLWREKPGDAEPEDPSGQPRPSQPYDRASAIPSVSSVGAAHAEFVTTLAGHPPRTIPLDADAIDLKDRADHLSKIFGALSVYVAVILDDTAQNVPGGLDLPYVEGVLAGLASDMGGTIQHAAEDMAGRIA